MAEREQIQRPAPQERATEVDTTLTDGVAESTEKGAALKAELDDLLDEIDEVLEVNAEDFVRSFVQKGGQ